ncbi:hypothetical protein AB1Y20_008783 [Prymnesium parvum]|uniref:VOC domain-containing protein n=1 Tax=Prymnesium parvum TaxID=97485 RepID=A0AB34IU07_PRYPA
MSFVAGLGYPTATTADVRFLASTVELRDRLEECERPNLAAPVGRAAQHGLFNLLRSTCPPAGGRAPATPTFPGVADFLGTRVHHLGVLTADLHAAEKALAALGFSRCSPVAADERRGCDHVLLTLEPECPWVASGATREEEATSTLLELVQPHDASRWLEPAPGVPPRGAAHHLCLEVADLDVAVQAAASVGAEGVTLVDEPAPSALFAQRRVAYVRCPAAGAMVCFLESYERGTPPVSRRESAPPAGGAPLVRHVSIGATDLQEARRCFHAMGLREKARLETAGLPVCLLLSANDEQEEEEGYPSHARPVEGMVELVDARHSHEHQLCVEVADVEAVVKAARDANWRLCDAPRALEGRVGAVVMHEKACLVVLLLQTSATEVGMSSSANPPREQSTMPGLTLARSIPGFSANLE